MLAGNIADIIMENCSGNYNEKYSGNYNGNLSFYVDAEN